MKEILEEIDSRFGRYRNTLSHIDSKMNVRWKHIKAEMEKKYGLRRIYGKE